MINSAILGIILIFKLCKQLRIPNTNFKETPHVSIMKWSGKFHNNEPSD